MMVDIPNFDDIQTFVAPIPTTYTRCRRCNAHLSSKESMARGYGKKCYEHKDEPFHKEGQCRYIFGRRPDLLQDSLDKWLK